MYKLKPFLSATFPRMFNSLYRIYSAGKLEPPLSLADALGLQPKIIYKLEAEPTSVPEPITAGEKGGCQCEDAGKVDFTSKQHKNVGQPMNPQDPGPPGKYQLQDKCDYFDDPRPNAKKWRSISLVVVPFVFGVSALILATKGESPEPEYIPYPYMYKRIKRFAWGDGRTTFFHGPHNFKPEEEEERLNREAEENPNQTGPRYKKRVNVEEEKKKLRDQHAQEELERRRKRHREEGSK